MTKPPFNLFPVEAKFVYENSETNKENNFIL